MNSVFAVGETVYDIIFNQGSPVAARPGGSMLNSAVSLGRCGIKVEMITELGDDHIGRLVCDFLEQNGVSTSFLNPVPGFKTPVSLAFLDESGNAHYSFYKNYPEHRHTHTWPVAGKGDVVLFGSFYSLDPAIREKLTIFIREAKSNGAIILYDPNIRKNHLDEIRQLMHLVEENILLSNIVRGSDEDFKNLYGLDDTNQIYNLFSSCGCYHLIITRGKYGADLITGNFTVHLPAEKIKVLSTIGAGDAFNAGIISGIIKKRFTVDDLVNINPDDWKEILGNGINFAADVCSNFDNYISYDLARTLLSTE